MVSQTLPGWFLDENGISYWYVDPAKAKEVANALFEEGKVVDVVMGEINNNNSSTKQVAMDQTKSAPVKSPQHATGTQKSSNTTDVDRSGATNNSSADGSKSDNDNNNSHLNNNSNGGLPGKQDGVQQDTLPPPESGQDKTQKNTTGNIVETQPEKNHV